MGKSKGGKYFKPPRTRGPPGGGRGEEDEEEEEDEPQKQRGVGAQRATVGMLPPSGSEDEDEEGEGGEEGDKKKKGEAGSSKPAAPPVAKNARAGELPPNSDDEDDEEDDDEDDSDDSDDQPVNEYLSAPRQRKPAQVEERDPETVRKDLERLQLIRKKREEDRLKRIADEGWDRFAPISDTNRPPGSIPSDHPSLTGKS